MSRASHSLAATSSLRPTRGKPGNRLPPTATAPGVFGFRCTSRFFYGKAELMDTLDLLIASRKYAEDVDHIVRDPGRVFEGEGRGCIAGIIGIVAGADANFDSDAQDDALSRTAAAASSLYGGYSQAMRGGQVAVLAVYDTAISHVAVEATADPAHVHRTVA